MELLGFGGGMRSTECPSSFFYRATLCVSGVFAVVRCLSVCLLSRWCIVSIRLKIIELLSRPGPPPSVWPHLFCGAGHEKRRGEQLKWSLALRLYIGSFVFHVHSYQDQFIQPGWAECVLYLA